MSILSYLETPVVDISDQELREAGVRLLLKKEYQNHPTVSGNKWWKLKYNLSEASRQGKKTLLTFGGAFSNHIYATAAAANELGFESIGIIRGEETIPLNPVLQFARDNGMKLHYTSRESYRRKAEPSFLQDINERFGDLYIIPEGGTNELAVQGCAEFAKNILSAIDFDSLWLPVATGGTLAGIIAGMEGSREVAGVSVLKGGEFLKQDVNALLAKYSHRDYGNWRIDTRFHFGGFAKTTPELLHFMRSQQEADVLLDKVYTAKMLFGIYESIRTGSVKGPCTILALHTGGLNAEALAE